jgi:hypothetical protein
LVGTVGEGREGVDCRSVKVHGVVVDVVGAADADGVVAVPDDDDGVELDGVVEVEGGVGVDGGVEVEGGVAVDGGVEVDGVLGSVDVVGGAVVVAAPEVVGGSTVTVLSAATFTLVELLVPETWMLVMGALMLTFWNCMPMSPKPPSLP